MLSKRLALITAVVLSLNCVSARAALLDFSFSFTTGANGGGFVEGIIRGLLDNGTSRASSVEVTSNTAGFGIGEYSGNLGPNSWSLSNGVITEVDFLSYGLLNTGSDAVTDSSLRLGIANGVSVAGLTNSPGLVSASSFAGLAFERLESSSDVPVPATLALFGLGLLGLGWARRKAA